MSLGRNPGADGIGIGGDQVYLSSYTAARNVSLSESRYKELQFVMAEVVVADYDTQEGENIGQVTFRPLTDKGKPPDNSQVAYPINSFVKMYPILHEIIYVVEFEAKYYYVSPLNLFNYVNNNASPNLTKSSVYSTQAQSGDYKTTVDTQMPNNANDTSDTALGKTFKDEAEFVGILRPKEGDLLIQGRFGNNIRIGNNDATNMPTIKMSVMDRRKSEFQIIDESLDSDTSIWLTSDEQLRFKPFGPKINSKNEPPNEYTGKQIAIFSDRIIFNAKAQEIIMMANKGIYLSANRNFSVDSNAYILLTSKSNAVITSPKIYLGADSATEPVILGNKLVELLSYLLDELAIDTHPTPAGPSGASVNASVYKDIKNQLKQVLSKRNFTL